MTRVRWLMLATLVAVAACKGDTIYKDTPDTLNALENCKRQMAEKDKLNQQYAIDLADKKQGGEILVAIEGDALVVKARKGGAGSPPIDDATAAKQSQAFLDLVSKSRGAIQKCYEQALKKNSGLQAVTISMTLSASFQASGDFTRMSTSKSLGDAFDACLRGVAQKWKLPPAPGAMAFQAPISLSPT